jgi:hypothetical protein
MGVGSPAARSAPQDNTVSNSSTRSMFFWDRPQLPDNYSIHCSALLLSAYALIYPQ